MEARGRGDGGRRSAPAVDPSSYPLIVMCNLAATGRHDDRAWASSRLSLTSILEECACSTPGRAPRLETRSAGHRSVRQAANPVSWRRYRRHAAPSSGYSTSSSGALRCRPGESHARLEPLLEGAAAAGGAAGRRGGRTGPKSLPAWSPRARAGQHPADGTARLRCSTSRNRTDMSLSLGMVRWYRVLRCVYRARGRGVHWGLSLVSMRSVGKRVGPRALDPRARRRCAPASSQRGARAVCALSLSPPTRLLSAAREHLIFNLTHSHASYYSTYAWSIAAPQLLGVSFQESKLAPLCRS